MRTLTNRWQSLSDTDMDRISEKIVGIHWLMMGCAILAWSLLPFLLGVSREVVVGRLW